MAEEVLAVGRVLKMHRSDAFPSKCVHGRRGTQDAREGQPTRNRAYSRWSGETRCMANVLRRLCVALVITLCGGSGGVACAGARGGQLESCRLQWTRLVWLHVNEADALKQTDLIAHLLKSSGLEAWIDENQSLLVVLVRPRDLGEAKRLILTSNGGVAEAMLPWRWLLWWGQSVHEAEEGRRLAQLLKNEGIELWIDRGHGREAIVVRADQYSWARMLVDRKDVRAGRVHLFNGVSR
jgi:hypothetical protein